MCYLGEMEGCDSTLRPVEREEQRRLRPTVLVQMNRKGGIITYPTIECRRDCSQIYMMLMERRRNSGSIQKTESKISEDP